MRGAFAIAASESRHAIHAFHTQEQIRPPVLQALLAVCEPGVPHNQDFPKMVYVPVLRLVDSPMSRYTAPYTARPQCAADIDVVARLHTHDTPATYANRAFRMTLQDQDICARVGFHKTHSGFHRCGAPRFWKWIRQSPSRATSRPSAGRNAWRWSTIMKNYGSPSASVHRIRPGGDTREAWHRSVDRALYPGQAVRPQPGQRLKRRARSVISTLESPNRRGDSVQVRAGKRSGSKNCR